jgi:hypothetical protein
MKEAETEGVEELGGNDSPLNRKKGVEQKPQADRPGGKHQTGEGAETFDDPPGEKHDRYLRGGSQGPHEPNGVPMYGFG